METLSADLTLPDGTKLHLDKDGWSSGDNSAISRHFNIVFNPTDPNPPFGHYEPDPLGAALKKAVDAYGGVVTDKKTREYADGVVY